MGKFLAVLTAYLLICNGYQMFRDPGEPKNDDLGPFYIFLTSIFLLLYDIRLYPKPLRKLDKLSQTVVEFFVAIFLMENILLDFWIPLENSSRAVLTNIAEKIEEWDRDDSVNFETIAEILKNPIVTTVVTYGISVFFLFSVLHAIRAVDFRAFEEGPSCFFGDILYRSKRFVKKKLRSLGLKRHRRVKIVETEEAAKKQKRSRTSMLVDDLCLENYKDFVPEDYEEGESLDESLQFSDFDIPDETDILCESL